MSELTLRESTLKKARYLVSLGLDLEHFARGIFASLERKVQSIESPGTIQLNLDQPECLPDLLRLRNRLRRWPYWINGQLQLAKIALAVNDIPLSFAATHCVEQLALDRRYIDVAKFIRAKCYLRSGEPQKALSLIDDLLKDSDLDLVELTEDKAASFMALDQNDLALEALRSIGKESLSQEGKTALKFLLGRENPAS